MVVLVCVFVCRFNCPYNHLESNERICMKNLREVRLGLRKTPVKFRDDTDHDPDPGYGFDLNSEFKRNCVSGQ